MSGPAADVVEGDRLDRGFDGGVDEVYVSARARAKGGGNV